MKRSSLPGDEEIVTRNWEAKGAETCRGGQTTPCGMIHRKEAKIVNKKVAVASNLNVETEKKD